MIGVDVRVRRKVYRSPPTVALEDLDFTVEPGAFVAIVGPSGSGKSTLLNIVAGLDRAFEGRIGLGCAVSQPRRAAPRVGFVFQQPRLMPWLTVLDNVCLVLEQTTEMTRHGRALLADVGLQKFENVFPGQLSGGMQRRVSLARAFAVRPELLLMDEPFLSLDDPTAWRLREQLMSLWGEHRPTVLYVTHDLREALTLAGRVLFFSDRPGRVILEYPNDIERPRRSSDPRVEVLQERLLAAHPHLLSGSAAGGEDPAGEDTTPATAPRPRAVP